MASMSDISLKLDDMTADFLLSTRVILCRASDCRNNSANVDKRMNRATCMLKRIDIGIDGKCYNYERKED